MKAVFRVAIYEILDNTSLLNIKNYLNSQDEFNSYQRWPAEAVFTQ
jgi:hypothetical protein